MRRYLIFILAVQIFYGLFLIGISFLNLPDKHALNKVSADISIIIDAMHSASPNPQQIERAATILADQKQTYEILTSTIVLLFEANIFSGIVLVFVGCVLLLDHLRRKGGLTSNKTGMFGMS